MTRPWPCSDPATTGHRPARQRHRRRSTNPLAGLRDGHAGHGRRPGGAVGGTAAPTQLITFAAPQTNRSTTLTFRQNITATETLRAGSYGKTLTFTLSTTAP